MRFRAVSESSSVPGLVEGLFCVRLSYQLRSPSMAVERGCGMDATYLLGRCSIFFVCLWEVNLGLAPRQRALWRGILRMPLHTLGISVLPG